jgi:hypothetical protein
MSEIERSKIETKYLVAASLGIAFISMIVTVFYSRNAGITSLIMLTTLLGIFQFKTQSRKIYALLAALASLLLSGFFMWLLGYILVTHVLSI